ncbi:MAG: SMI1/KNR4 family protein [Oscillospiraceae bacterium]|nr:SMI1/KNR4 family protein [Oscillospiraceae bacterium]
MSNIIETIRSLPKMEGYKPASKIEISDAEIQLCLHFADEYKTYLAEFGEVSAQGLELTGIIDADYINVISATKEKWDLNPTVPRNLYVIEDTTIDGIVIWQDGNGIVYKTTPHNEPIKIAESMLDYLKMKK